MVLEFIGFRLKRKYYTVREAKFLINKDQGSITGGCRCGSAGFQLRRSAINQQFVMKASELL